MKKELSILSTTLVAVLLFSSCSDKGTIKFAKTDVPAYALGENYFIKQASQSGSLKAVSGNSQNEFERGVRLQRTNVVGNKENFYYDEQDMQQYDKPFRAIHNDVYTPYRYLADATKTISVMIDDRGEERFGADWKGVSFSDNYLFCDTEKLQEAIKLFNETEFQKNKPSSYEPSEENGGTHTYHANCIAAVHYYGAFDEKTVDFLSLYLDCGAVVQRKDAGAYDLRRFVGKELDCLVDDDNNIVESKIVVAED
jgi:hypothetical protein